MDADAITRDAGYEVAESGDDTFVVDEEMIDRPCTKNSQCGRGLYCNAPAWRLSDPFATRSGVCKLRKAARSECSRDR